MYVMAEIYNWKETKKKKKPKHVTQNHSFQIQ